MAQLVTIDNGNVKIQDGTLRLIHFIDLDRYEHFLKETYDEITTQVPKDHFLYPILQHETTQTFEILNTLKPVENSKRRRSIDILGTAWKYIDGSTDHNDLSIINDNLNNLNQNNNNQIIINNLFEKRINNITNIVNKMLNTIKKDEDIITEIMINLQNRIRLIKEELINIKYAIQWAKKNIVNSIILSNDEIKLSIKKVKEEKMPFKNAEEALKFSKINVLSKEMTILYMIKIPLTLYETFERIIIRPVKKENDVIIKTDYKEILKGRNKIYGIKSDCENINELAICKETNLIDLSNDVLMYK